MRALVVFGANPGSPKFESLTELLPSDSLKRQSAIKFNEATYSKKLQNSRKDKKSIKSQKNQKKFTKFQKNQKDDNSSLNTSVIYKLFRVPNATGPLIIFTIQSLRTSNLLFAEQFCVQFNIMRR